MRILLIICAMITLAAPVAAHAPADPIPPRLNAYLRTHYSEDPSSRFAVAWADLDRDGSSEAIVHVLGRGWCGSGGCLMLVLTPTGDSYRQVGRTTIVNTPIRLLPTRSKGWHDIGVVVQGGGIVKGYVAALRFNGSTYPSNPSVPPAVPLKHTPGAILIGPNAPGMPLTRQ